MTANCRTVHPHCTSPVLFALSSILTLTFLFLVAYAALASPRAASSPAFRPTMQTLPLTTRTSLGTAPSLTPRSGAFAPIGTPLSTGTGAASGSQALAAPAIRMHSFAEEADEPQYVSEWQETEELHCVLAHCEPLPGVGTFPEGNVAPGVATSLKGRPVIAPVELQPGVSQLTFLAAPVKRGVYKPVRITGLLGQLPVSLKVSLPPDLDGTAANGTATAHEDAVVLQVEGPAPRVSLAAVAAGGACLVAGQRQWLGFHVTPGRDTLESSSLAVTWPLPPGVADIARKVTGLLGLQAPPPALNAADISLATSGGAGAPGAGAPQSPVLLPQHAAAVVSGLGDEAASKSVLVCANSDSGDGAPAWIDGGCEEISIPEKCSARGAATAWWWVDVGPFAGAPEQVQVAAPGAMGVGSSWAPQEGHPHAGPEAGMGPAVAAPAMLDISVALQYVSGCRRTYTRVLSVPVQQPFAVHTTGETGSNLSFLKHSATCHSVIDSACMLETSFLLP